VPQKAQPPRHGWKRWHVLRILQFYLQLEGPLEGLSAKGERSSMVEDTPAPTEHGRGRRVLRTVRGTVPREVPF
jgi:hypothetical protein